MAHFLVHHLLSLCSLPLLLLLIITIMIMMLLILVVGVSASLQSEIRRPQRPLLYLPYSGSGYQQPPHSQSLRQKLTLLSCSMSAKFYFKCFNLLSQCLSLLEPSLASPILFLYPRRCPCRRLLLLVIHLHRLLFW